MNLEAILAQLHARQNDPVLPVTLHILANPIRIAILDAEGNRREYMVNGNELVSAIPEAQHEQDSIKPPAQRIAVEGMEAALYGKF